MSASLRFQDVSVGDELPPLDVPITPALIIGGAIASNDFTPVHHDKEVARGQGLPDIIMNILTTNGFVGRYVTDWAGPDAQVRELQVKLGGPNVPGDTMKITGSVVSVEGGVVEVQVTGKNSWGNHVDGTVKLALPTEA